jgi:hypothetical protein
MNGAAWDGAQRWEMNVDGEEVTIVLARDR